MQAADDHIGMTAKQPLKDLVIVVTGASAGIGAAVARQASAAGARVAMSARREKELRDVSAGCPQSLAVVADVTKRSEVERLSSEVIAHYGHYDVWINNVGRGISRLPSELTDADIDEMVEVNVKSALYGMQVRDPRRPCLASASVAHYGRCIWPLSLVMRFGRSPLST
jgi:NADP-dependent 3-hydroxy acid dehydrogenase YdfG